MTTIPYEGNLAWIHDRTILLTKHGSHAYGLATETSDLDLKGVAIPPREYMLGFVKNFEQLETREPCDMVIYELRKFCRLAADCNPNIIEVLWTDPSDHLLRTPLGDKLVEARASFLSRKARHTFSGYAMSQLKRIKTHRRWLIGPPEAQPTRGEFGLPERTVIPADQLMAAESQIRKQVEAWDVDLGELDQATRIQLQARWTEVLTEMSLVGDAQWRAAGRTLGYDDNFLELLERERRYKTAQDEWRQFNDWKAKRNPARAALEAKHGFDTKHASHLVRLMRMCREILETGQVWVKRPDHEELRAIRAGAWDYDRLIEWADAQDKLMGEAEKSSPLPKSPDRDALDRLCVELIEASLA